MRKNREKMKNRGGGATIWDQCRWELRLGTSQTNAQEHPNICWVASSMTKNEAPSINRERTCLSNVAVFQRSYPAVGGTDKPVLLITHGLTMAHIFLPWSTEMGHDIKDDLKN
jgi:hypothetical protein